MYLLRARITSSSAKGQKDKKNHESKTRIWNNFERWNKLL